MNPFAIGIVVAWCVISLVLVYSACVIAGRCDDD